MWWGQTKLEVIDTAGPRLATSRFSTVSPGLLFSGDHILFAISPGLGLRLGIVDTMGIYLSNLQRCVTWEFRDFCILMEKFVPTGASVLRGLKPPLRTYRASGGVYCRTPWHNGRRRGEKPYVECAAGLGRYLPGTKVVHRRRRHYYPEPPYCRASSCAKRSQQHSPLHAAVDR